MAHTQRKKDLKKIQLLAKIAKKLNHIRKLLRLAKEEPLVEKIVETVALALLIETEILWQSYFLLLVEESAKSE